MSEKDNSVLELSKDAQIKTESTTSLIARELGRAFLGATVTSASVIGGASTGVASAIAFSYAGEVAGHLMSSTNLPAFVALGTAFNAPFIHHIFKGELAQRLSGSPNPNGAFTKAAKTTSYIGGALGLLGALHFMINGAQEHKASGYNAQEISVPRNDPKRIVIAQPQHSPAYA